MNETRGFYLAFADFLICMLALVLIQFHIQIEEHKGQPSPVMSMYMIWDEGKDIDMDIYILTPDNKSIWYKNKAEGGEVWIDRDDIGTLNNNGDMNMEIVKWGAIKNGIYFVSIHTYAVRNILDGRELVSVELVDKDGRSICHEKFPMPQLKQEKGLFAITVKDGQVKCQPSNLLIRQVLEKEHQAS